MYIFGEKALALIPGRRNPFQKYAIFLCALLGLTQIAMGASGFTPQRRVGGAAGDQWEPAMAADPHGHVYILYPQYGPTANCPRCSIPAITLLVSDDNGVSWHASRPLLPYPTGQFDPQIVVDPADKQTIYASWLQNNRHDTVVARSLDFGRTWSFSIADRSVEDVDKPVLAVRGPDVYVGFNHDEKFFVAASHDAGQTFAAVNINPEAISGSSLAGGATVDPSGNVFFGWAAYARRSVGGTAVNIYVSRSTDAGHSWTNTLLDTSSRPPDCKAQECETAFLGAQVALSSDSAGTLYALWNTGYFDGAPERIYFSSSTTGGATWTPKADVSKAPDSVDSGFPAIVAGTPGDVRIAWMDTRAGSIRGSKGESIPIWNTLYRASTNGGATWSPEQQLSTPVTGFSYILPKGFKFPFGDYFSIAIDSEGATQVVWGEGENYKSPGSLWYARGH